MAEDPPSGPDQSPEPDAGFVLGVGVLIYGVMGTVALIWLWSRDRMQALPEQAIGSHGPVVASGLGLAVGLLSAVVMAWASRRFSSLREVSSAAQRVFRNTGETVGIAFVLVAAVAEELFFRLAVQDAFGLLGSVATYVLLNSTLGRLEWFVFTFLHAAVLGSIVQLGFGLLGSTTAHAVLNYLSLRSIQDR